MTISTFFILSSLVLAFPARFAHGDPQGTPPATHDCNLLINNLFADPSARSLLRRNTSQLLTDLIAEGGVTVRTYRLQVEGQEDRYVIHVLANGPRYEEALRRIQEIQSLSAIHSPAQRMQFLLDETLPGEIPAVVGAAASDRGTGDIVVLTQGAAGPDLAAACTPHGFRTEPVFRGLTGQFPIAELPATSPQVTAARRLREELAARFRGLARGTPYTSPTDLNRPEAPYLDGTAQGGRVIYFGSDSALTHLLLNFPTAREYHLADLWSGHAPGTEKSPREKFNTIQNTLAAIHPEARVEITDNGFTSLFTPAQMASFDAFQTRATALAADPRMLRPMVMRVRWTSPTEGPQERLVFIHQTDFRNPARLTSFLGSFPEQGISGVFFRGAPLPSPDGLRQILGRMDPNGLMVADGYSTSPFVTLADTNPVVRVITPEANFLVRPNPRR